MSTMLFCRSTYTNDALGSIFFSVIATRRVELPPPPALLCHVLSALQCIGHTSVKTMLV